MGIVATFPMESRASRRPQWVSIQSPDTLALAPCHSGFLLLPAPTHATTTAAALERFTVNFTITNLPYTSDLENPDSAKYNATQSVTAALLDRLLKESSIGPNFQGCVTTAFRPGSDRDETRVDAVCTYSKEPSAAPLDRVGLYHQVSNKTRGITQLGPYSLDKDSLYVNGYNEQPVLTTPTHATTTAAALEHFTVNFTITNLPYTSDLENPDSAKFRATQRVMNMLLDRLLKESSIGPVFQRCETTDLRYGSCSNVPLQCSHLCKGTSHAHVLHSYRLRTFSLLLPALPLSFLSPPHMQRSPLREVMARSQDDSKFLPGPLLHEHAQNVFEGAEECRDTNHTHTYFGKANDHEMTKAVPRPSLERMTCRGEYSRRSLCFAGQAVTGTRPGWTPCAPTARSPRLRLWTGWGCTTK
ncbi:mucin-16-like [Corvus moneduloides]|uniref:mucin-16-like n=1 Tax=Corvus moneduloides TaxID=1196302 RepID=UPI00136208F9|nr:mucin-16-like [Corvus moneduloides]